MARVLILLPQRDFDPTEVAVPWAALTEAGHGIRFASETGEAAACDPVTLTGEGLPRHARSLTAQPDNQALYRQMIATEAFAAPIRWADASVADVDAVLFPGGHAPGMRPYCESAEVQRIGREAFSEGKLVAAICHGVLPLARSRDAGGAPLLAGRRTTALTSLMERFAILLTRGALGNHYRTYGETVETEVRRAVGPDGGFDTGPLIPRYATATQRSAGFIVKDGNYLSARWPGDAWTLAQAMCERLSAPAQS